MLLYLPISRQVIIAYMLYRCELPNRASHSGETVAAEQYARLTEAGAHRREEIGFGARPEPSSITEAIGELANSMAPEAHRRHGMPSRCGGEEREGAGAARMRRAAVNRLDP